jgi:hypothetical protein
VETNKFAYFYEFRPMQTLPEPEDNISSIAAVRMAGDNAGRL